METMRGCKYWHTLTQKLGSAYKVYSDRSSSKPFRIFISGSSRSQKYTIQAMIIAWIRFVACLCHIIYPLSCVGVVLSCVEVIRCLEKTKHHSEEKWWIKKHCQRHYGPRRWLLWPVILVWKVWFSMLNRLSLILLVGSVGRFGLVVLDW